LSGARRFDETERAAGFKLNERVGQEVFSDEKRDER
jgi:hypothetical protein